VRARFIVVDFNKVFLSLYVRDDEKVATRKYKRRRRADFNVGGGEGGGGIVSLIKK